MKKTILTVIGLALLASACGTSTNTIPSQTTPNGVLPQTVSTLPAQTLPTVVTVGSASNMSALYSNVAGNYSAKIGTNGVDSLISISKDKVTFASTVANFTVDYDLTSLGTMSNGQILMVQLATKDSVNSDPSLDTFSLSLTFYVNPSTMQVYGSPVVNYMPGILKVNTAFDKKNCSAFMCARTQTKLEFNFVRK